MHQNSLGIKFGLHPIVSFNYFYSGATRVIFVYVLYLCVQSHMTCDVVKENAKTVDGIKHFDLKYGTMELCQTEAAERSKVKPDKGGYYFVEYNKWYECRKERPPGQ